MPGLLSEEHISDDRNGLLQALLISWPQLPQLVNANTWPKKTFELELLLVPHLHVPENALEVNSKVNSTVASTIDWSSVLVPHINIWINMYRLLLCELL